MKTSLATTAAVVIAAAGMLATMPVNAHHSSAMFDFSENARVEFKAVVERFAYTQPHSWLYVKNAETGESWGFEMASPSLLRGRGIAPTTFRAGDEITVLGAPLRDGRTAGSLVCAILGDGQRVECPQE